MPQNNGRSASRILLVDDEPQMVAMVNVLLRKAAYDTVTLQSPAQALLLTSTDLESFDLLLTDFQMPGLNGIELAQRLLQVQPHLKVIVMSGIPTVVEETDKAGFAFLGKPFAVSDLLELIRETLAAAA
jgi:DNA-binding NtrC family response regulator